MAMREVHLYLSNISKQLKHYINFTMAMCEVHMYLFKNICKQLKQYINFGLYFGSPYEKY